MDSINQFIWSEFYLSFTMDTYVCINVKFCPQHLATLGEMMELGTLHWNCNSNSGEIGSKPTLEECGALILQDS